ncbi:dynein regulatory complex protein 10 isoform X1 [Simochromis diagramma]|uniref:dynein regulatory complex protein 10 isoform X1 n=2 Tax=Simochromis diagramma TaxID=43689 RepID=UPI001A7EB4D2|nr:dynein regulatory complex protein 10 isoform X1 [Simochromis diagramma]
MAIWYPSNRKTNKTHTLTERRLQSKPLSVDMSEDWLALLPNSQSEDGCLVQSKHLSSEAHIILSTLENCISKIETAAALPALLHLNSKSEIVDKDLSKALEKHRILVERLEKLESLKQESVEEQIRDARIGGEKERAQLGNDLKNSVRDILRYCRAHSDGIIGLRAELDIKIEEKEYKLIKGLKVLHSQMVEKFLISPDEELQLITKQKEFSSSAKDLEKNISLEEEEVAKAIQQVDAEISQKENTIKHLESLLQACSPQEGDVSDDNMSPFEDKQVQAHIQVSKLKQDRLQQEIDQLKIQLKNVVLENRQTERLLQEKNEKMQGKIDSLIQKFDNEIGEIQAKLEVNENAYEMEDNERKKFEKPFATLEMEYNQIQERRRLAEEKRQEEIRELELKTKAAILIQAWWRGYSVRKALKNKAKSKKAKSDKGKGKGKKTK